MIVWGSFAIMEHVCAVIARNSFREQNVVIKKKENQLFNLVIELVLLIEPKKLYNEICSIFDLCNDVLDLKCENYVCKCYSDKYYDIKSNKCSKLKLTFW